MLTVYGTSYDEMTRTLDEFEALFLREMTRVMKEVASRLGVVTVAAAEPPPGEPAVSLDTLALIATLWASVSGGALLAEVTAVYLRGARMVAGSVTGVLSRRKKKRSSRDEKTPGITPTYTLPDVAPSDDEILTIPETQDFLAAAKNRMVRFSDVMWEIARAQLLEGFMEGESIDELRDRLVSVAGLSNPRARTVARTEIISAENAGSIAMVEALGFTGSKIWEATEDERTRATHVIADQQKVGLKDSFIVGGFRLYFPGDPSGPPQECINCRCSLTYSLNDDNDDDDTFTATGVVMDPESEWIGVLAVEGKKTGDMRMFAPGSLSWADLPLPLLWQKETSEGHDGASVVGNITAITRQGDMIIGRGTFDMADEDGAEAYRRMRDGYLSGVSIDADNLTPDDVEYIYSDTPASDLTGPSLAMTIFHAGRIRGATLVAIPAFVEARLSAVPQDAAMGDDYLMADNYSMIAAAIASHDTATVDKPWNKSVAEKRLPSPMPVATARSAFAWMDDGAVKDGKIAKGACKFPHHEVSGNGVPGAANLAACSAGIAALHGARGGTDIPESDRKGVYNHLARHLRDGGREVPDFSVDSLTAASYVLTIPDVPLESWFDEPDVADMHGALTVTDQGRVYGWLAPADVAHRSFQQRVTVPMGNVDYSLFLGRETITAGGGRVITGALTMDCGHASTGFSDPVAALDHYDNACSIVASVRIGESARGVWVAGALIPGVSANQISRMMACQLSGDWRPHRDRRGWREFAGALLVPVPGFAMSRSQASVRVENGELVASAIPVEFKASECECMGMSSFPPVPKPRPTYGRTAALLALSLGLDKASRVARMRSEVNREAG